MSGDGVSLQTTISQMGNVAKAQLKGQQQNQPTAPLSEEIDKSKDLKVNRATQAEKTEKGRIEKDEQKKKRQTKKRKRRPKNRPKAKQTAVPDDDAKQNGEEQHDIGLNIDTRV